MKNEWNWMRVKKSSKNPPNEPTCPNCQCEVGEEE
tara:strand:- start:5299 stop:5403 length:105 start_codon:yes stop_codon:yes gene_type:complete